MSTPHPAPKPTPETPALEASGLSVAHRSATRPAVTGARFRVPQGCRAALIGPNGAGKSALLPAFAGLLAPAAGEALALGSACRVGRREIAFLAQRAEIEWALPVTVLNLVLSGLPGAGRSFFQPGKTDRETALAALRRVRLEDLADRRIEALSGGQRQRALLARALCQDARILLLDEPYAGLDSASRDILENLFFGPESGALTLLMATHEPGHAARFDLTLAVEDGRVAVLHPCTCPVPHARLVDRPAGR